jgi:uncharacterized protein
MRFRERYGPWGLIAGASDGVGAEAARLLGERGVNVVMVARRQYVLDEVAESVATKTRTLALDLSDPDSSVLLAQATADLEIGLFIYNAGAVNPAGFLENPVEKWRSAIERNCLTVARSVHHFAGLMTKRGRGGIVLVSSQGAWCGGAQLAVYSATKAFDLVFAEGLWAELKSRGVDVLAMVLGATDTPAFLELLDGAAIPMDSSKVVAAAMLDNIANGPTWPPDPPRSVVLSRREAVEQYTAGVAGMLALIREGASKQPAS